MTKYLCSWEADVLAGLDPWKERRGPWLGRSGYVLGRRETLERLVARGEVTVACFAVSNRLPRRYRIDPNPKIHGRPAYLIRVRLKPEAYQ